MNQTPFTVGLIQMKVKIGDRAANLDHACALLEQAAQKGAQVVCLPELFMSEYFCQRETQEVFDLAEPIPGPTTDRLSEVAKAHNIVIVASLFEKRAPGICHNTAVVFDADGTMLGLYRKMHIPHDPLFYEKYYFSPGDTGFRTFDTKYGRIGVLVCWDQWFPEGARITALKGAKILFYPTAIAWHPSEKAEWGASQQSAWETMQRSHAIANGVYVAAVNRVGHEIIVGNGLEFWGHSFISDPFGRLLQVGGDASEEILIDTVNPALQEEVRRNWPFFRDRRIDAYGDILKHPEA